MPEVENFDQITKRKHARLLARELLASIKLGKLALGNQTMLLLHAEAFGAMRQELILTLGKSSAQDTLTRIGYVAGTRAAAVARSLLPDATMLEQILFGPSLHGLEGFVEFENVCTEVDPETGTYACEHIWTRSMEATLHLSTQGLSAHPICWLQAGYASGFATASFGRPVIHREVECLGKGDPVCRLVGELAEKGVTAGQANRRFLQPHVFVNCHLGSEDKSSEKHAGIVGASTGLFAACDQIERVAKTDATILFLGETGVGKELFAKMVHKISARAAAPFVAVNCATLPNELVESELFGTEVGAFTGAKKREGRFQRANGGTLFLDEIGTLSLAAQAKLLRALQERKVESVGGPGPVPVDFRLCCATNLDLLREVAAGRFRDDLYYRIAVVPVTIAPLRRRVEDIPLLLRHFLNVYVERHKQRQLGVSERALSSIMAYHFPGNVRELENMVERAVILAPEDGLLDTFHFFADAPPSPATSTGPGNDVYSGVGQTDGIKSFARLKTLEQNLVEQSLARTNGNMSAAARDLGITRSRLIYRLKKHGARSVTNTG